MLSRRFLENGLQVAVVRVEEGHNRYVGLGALANRYIYTACARDAAREVGRSTQIALLREWLEANGYAVAETGQQCSELAGKGIKKAKNGHSMRDLTVHLFCATDFVGRLDAGTPMKKASGLPPPPVVGHVQQTLRSTVLERVYC